MILMALHDAAESEGVVDLCSGKLVDQFWLKSVDRCLKSDVDRHQCDPPKLIELSTSKSPSCGFSCFTICQNSSSIMAFTWCFIGSSPTPLLRFLAS
ncbi:hypothetical protein F2Q68_00031244 [Brassica cretica]|uniref:Uncharacterized protein n=1 Tax=Brassica cretica TaxID=69181 RepID=A0A8S9GC32_BRACR|nr:hypothetical protein F2Q68_00031244 [Brassica cretica]